MKEFINELIFCNFNLIESNRYFIKANNKVLKTNLFIFINEKENSLYFLNGNDLKFYESNNFKTLFYPKILLSNANYSNNISEFFNLEFDAFNNNLNNLSPVSEHKLLNQIFALKEFNFSKISNELHYTKTNFEVFTFPPFSKTLLIHKNKYLAFPLKDFSEEKGLCDILIYNYHFTCTLTGYKNSYFEILDNYTDDNNIIHLFSNPLPFYYFNQYHDCSIFNIICIPPGNKLFSYYFDLFKKINNLNKSVIKVYFSCDILNLLDLSNFIFNYLNSISEVKYESYLVNGTLNFSIIYNSLLATDRKLKTLDFIQLIADIKDKLREQYNLIDNSNSIEESFFEIQTINERKYNLNSNEIRFELNFKLSFDIMKVLINQILLFENISNIECVYLSDETSFNDFKTIDENNFL
ncbi:MAG: hypothetical protein ACK4K9_10050 [Bacteroidia bacterium]